MVQLVLTQSRILTKLQKEPTRSGFEAGRKESSRLSKGEPDASHNTAHTTSVRLVYRIGRKSIPRIRNNGYCLQSNSGRNPADDSLIRTHEVLNEGPFPDLRPVLFIKQPSLDHKATFDLRIPCKSFVIKVCFNTIYPRQGLDRSQLQR